MESEILQRSISCARELQFRGARLSESVKQSCGSLLAFHATNGCTQGDNFRRLLDSAIEHDMLAALAERRGRNAHYLSKQN